MSNEKYEKPEIKTEPPIDEGTAGRVFKMWVVGRLVKSGARLDWPSLTPVKWEADD